MMKKYKSKAVLPTEGLRPEYKGEIIKRMEKDTFVECMNGLYEEINNKGVFLICVSSRKRIRKTIPESCELETVVTIESVETRSGADEA